MECRRTVRPFARLEASDRLVPNQIAANGTLGGIGDRRREFGEGPRPKMNQVDSYFMLEMQTRQLRRFSSLDERRAALLPLGLEPQLMPIWRIYNKYRFGWFDALAATLFCLPVLLGFALLTRRALQLRSRGEIQ